MSSEFSNDFRPDREACWDVRIPFIWQIINSIDWFLYLLGIYDLDSGQIKERSIC